MVLGAMVGVLLSFTVKRAQKLSSVSPVLRRLLLRKASGSPPILRTNVYYLAHMNYARLKAPMDDPSMAEFKAAMDPINVLAKRTPGYVWSLDNPLQTDVSSVSLLRDDPLLMPQLSLWENPQAIQHFAFKSGHFMYYKRKREWFTSPTPPWSVCWWFLSTDEFPVPTLSQAFGRLQILRENQISTPDAFELSSAKEFPKPTIKQ